MIDDENKDDNLLLIESISNISTLLNDYKEKNIKMVGIITIIIMYFI